MKLGWTSAYRASFLPDITLSFSGPTSARRSAALRSLIQVPFGRLR